MDIFSHGLWAAAAAKGVNQSRWKRLNLWVAGLWGIFPDLFAFTIPFAWMMWAVVFGGLDMSQLRGHHDPLAEPVSIAGSWTFMLAGALYNVSHSLFVFALVFFIIWVSFRRPMWEMGGWFLHILSDIPTHSYQFFPTPAFWPFFDWKFDGFSWGTLWFLIPNYILLILVFIFIQKWRNGKSLLSLTKKYK